ncbi:MAG: ATP-dependent DNA helicase RecG [Candidatus Moranbacteria bacterium GW2011_GWE1_35_17]|nr:MAG: ATP-dependent DNA helicase RecG [Candidatus Moranbacteria bacterium GW2011_GWE1_35_17]KKP82907.1 MAG: ATP-dependent DNA helicase RecG [Candidatus Moranbacteria bacterium GW2011_GWF1_35_5]
MLNLKTPIDKTFHIKPAQAEKLKKLGITAVGDFLFHFPARYDDLSNLVSISEIIPEQSATVSGEIIKFALKRSWHKKISIIEIQLRDETGIIRATWFNQKYLIDVFSKNKFIRLSGKAKLDKNGFYFSNPIWEVADKNPNHTGRIVPIYPETRGITSKWLRWQIETIFKNDFDIVDPLPVEILKKYHLPTLKKALYDVHFPRSENSYLVAQKRFAFFDMFLIQLRALQIKKQLKKESAQELEFPTEKIKKFLASLPFSLTNDQKKAFTEIKKDLTKKHPMNRLLNGDVGSGKTIVAILAALQTSTNGFQAAIMAPTEVLAYQHFENFSKLLADFDISIGLLTNSYKLVYGSRSTVHGREGKVIGHRSLVIKNNPSIIIKNSSLKNSKLIQNSKLEIENYSTAKISRETMLEEIKVGNIDIVIGTHAIIQKDIRFKNLALIIIDEQHRFGVMQRSYLQQKITEINDGLPDKIPHLLSMTATPIPRTISMTLLGSLDVSLITEMPKNRKPIITKVILPDKQNEVYNFIRQEIKNGRQAFVIFPLVEESEKLAEVKAAVTEHARLLRDVFPEFKLGLLHGRMKSKEKEEIMLNFKNKKTDILVSTSVIEVGIDIPNATVMIVEEAYRFGLSQLHQFRGRVGRGEFQSYCFLFAKNSTTRLRILEKYTDGFKVAQEDLEIRGPGDFLGNRQSGLADSTMQNITNIKMIKCAYEEAREIINHDVALKNNLLLKEELEKMNRNIHLE